MTASVLQARQGLAEPLLDTVRSGSGFHWRSNVCLIRLAATHIQDPVSLSGDPSLITDARSTLALGLYANGD